MESPLDRSSSSELPGLRRRRRTVVLVAALVALLHAVLLGAARQVAIGMSREASIGAPMAVRTIEAAADPGEAEPPPAVQPAPELPAPEVARPAPPAPRAPRAPARSRSEVGARSLEAASSAASEPVLAAAEPAPPADAASEPGPSEVRVEASASAPLTQVEPVAPEAASAASRAASASFLAAGEQPPPTYRTILPAAATLRYQVRRGFFRGSGEIRWQPDGDRYELHLDARLAGITLLSQTSQGEIGASGLAPLRFVDQRARRAAQAANFRREAGTITFSGPSTEWPLLAGTQDRLSWMIQLVGIVAAEPERATEGGRISMVLVGARGEASVRTLRFVGRENAETASESVPALKFVVDGRSAYDTSYEIWLDPARGYLPVHATARNSAGESELDLLLERIEP